MKFVAINGQLQEAVPVVTIPEHGGILWPLFEKGRDAATDGMSDASLWILQQLGAVMKDLGMWLVQISPDLLLILSMIFCLGAIASIPKMGKWAAGSMAAAVVMEIVKGSVIA